jgi:hypothetical protein
MLRGSRAHDAGAMIEAVRNRTMAPRDFLVAVAPLPRGETFSISGWPKWLVPGQVTLTRAVRPRSSDENEPH